MWLYIFISTWLLGCVRVWNKVIFCTGNRPNALRDTRTRNAHTVIRLYAIEHFLDKYSVHRRCRRRRVVFFLASGN